MFLTSLFKREKFWPAWLYLFLIIISGCSSENDPIQKAGSAARVKNIILLIGDGMGTAQIYAGKTANKGKLNLDRCTAIGFHNSQSSDDYVTDSGAGATAFAIGRKPQMAQLALIAQELLNRQYLKSQNNMDCQPDW
ncbi:MAG TPA: alkaline phosphatase [Flavitalea sp.]|nr:alkaline phosphatase [Flavitalea sp.]